MGLARDESRKHSQRKYSNSLRHTEWRLPDGYGSLIVYEDTACRFIADYGLFEEGTSEQAVEVLETPHQAFVRKMPEERTVIDEESERCTMPRKRRKGYTRFTVDANRRGLSSRSMIFVSWG